MNKLIGNHRKLKLGEICEAFPDALPVIDRELKRLEREVKIYTKVANRIKNGLYTVEEQDFGLMVLKEIYMRPDKRFEQIKQLRAMQRMMSKPVGDISYKDWDEKVIRCRQIPIETIYDFKGLKKTRRGFTSLCPFHQDEHASFSCRDNKWICFTCQKKGSGAIDFIMELNNVSFREAVRILDESK